MWGRSVFHCPFCHGWEVRDRALAGLRSPADTLTAVVFAGPLAADAVEIDATSHTGVPGLFAAGDVTGQMPSVANVTAAGSSAAATIVHGLMAEAHSLPRREDAVPAGSRLGSSRAGSQS